MIQESPPSLFKGAFSVSGRKWKEKPYDPRLALLMSQLFTVSPFVGQLLSSRGLTPESAPDYLYPTLKKLLPDPSHLKDMDKGIERVVNALKEGEKIAIFGDYDVDGATASALFKRYFEDIGKEVTVYIPQRIEEGYGPNIEAMTYLKKQGHTLVIMVDCGTTAFEVLAQSQVLGLDIIIIDHHLSAPLLPEVAALINPNRIDESSPLTGLCAAGLSFVFLVGLHRILRDEKWFEKEKKKEPDLRHSLDLVALGTVCDVMPLIGLNRAFVVQGLKMVRQRTNLGLKALADIGGIEEPPNVYHLGFILGPRINAGGRVGKSNLGSRLLSSRDPIEVEEIARQLHQLNKERQEIEKTVLDDATNRILQHGLDKNPLILIQGEKWHGGVIGIVAGRLKERFQKPVCVVGFEDNVGKGSGRSIPGINLGNIMHLACQKGVLAQGGGHAMAAGFTVMKDQYKAFEDFLYTHLASQIACIEPELTLDALLSTGSITIDFLHELNLLAPYGNGNPSPLFGLSKVRLVNLERVGVNHLRALAYGEEGTRLKVMAFRAFETPLGDHLYRLQGRIVTLAGTLKLDTWKGRTEITFILEDIME